MFLAELNHIQLWGADAGNTYLKALTKEKIYIVASPELKSHKDMYLLCTRHSMAQDLEEHVGMISSLTFFNKWISSLQEQILTYG